MYSTRQGYSVAQRSSNTRDRFIRRTYTHLLGAVALFAYLEYFLFTSGIAGKILSMMAHLNWLFILGPFILVSWLATRFASSSQSQATQYLGLGLYIVAQALIFVPILAIAQVKSGGGVIESAAVATGIGFFGLTTIAFATKTDFSFLGKAILFAGVGALILIVCGSLFGFNLGVYFSVAMVVLSGMAILHDTSRVIHHYGEHQYVAASLQLFASVAMMFFYILRIFSARD